MFQLLRHPAFPFTAIAQMIVPSASTEERLFADSINAFLLTDHENGVKKAVELIKECARVEANQQGAMRTPRLPNSYALHFLENDLLLASEGTLFRDNTFLTHLLAGFGRLVGAPFLKSTIMFTVLDIAAKTHSDTSCFEAQSLISPLI